MKVARSWQQFVADTGYRVLLSDDRRVLLLLSDTYAPRKDHKENHEVEVMRELLAQSAEVVGRFLPEPDPNAVPAVVVCVRSSDYPRLLDHVAKMDDRIAEWAQSAAGTVCGFTLSSPLVAGWIEDPEGVTEWHPYNELVHRTAQLLIRQRYPRLPQWLLLGLAWHVEDTVRASVYCFPYRSGFVSAMSHADWGLWLANNFKRSRRKKADAPLTLQFEEFADWNPRKAGFDPTTAYLAFGVARFLAVEHPDEVDPVLKQLADAMRDGSRQVISDTEWREDPNYQVPIDDQRAVLEAVDPKLCEHVTRFFQRKQANQRQAPTVGSRHW